MNAFALRATATDYVPKVAQSFLNEHIRAAEVRDARIAELEALCAAKDARIADLEKEFGVIEICYNDRDKENEALKAKIALLEKDLEDSISAHAGDSALDADKLAAQAKFAVANVEPYVRTEWDKVLFKANKHGLARPYYKNVNVADKAGKGNGETIMDRNELKDCIAKGVPIFGMDNRVPEGLEDALENRRKMYVPYSEYEEDQKAFEKLYPKFTQHKDGVYKKMSNDRRCDKRAAPRGRK
jgi:hypothetical protein